MRSPFLDHVWSSGRLLVLLLAILAGCAAPPAPSPSSRDVAPAPPPAVPPSAPPDGLADGTVVGRGDRLLVYLAKDGDTLADVAARLLGHADRAWQIAEVNPGLAAMAAGQPVVVPLQMPNPLGVSPDGVQVVQILCYHRLGPVPSKMVVTPASFEAQMAWLASNGWHVVRLSDVAEFLAGRRALPRQSVAITFDDGYASVYRHAFPVLKKHGFPATNFVYTDFIGAADAASWPQLEEMQRSGLVDTQSHSKSHRNLTDRGPDESEASYLSRLDSELRVPRQAIERALAGAGVRVRQLAFPYGDANRQVLEAMPRHGFEVGLTVTPGGNPFYASPLMLRRVMIFGDQGLDQFRQRLQPVVPISPDRRPMGSAGDRQAGAADFTGLQALEQLQRTRAQAAAQQQRWVDALWAWDVVLALRPQDTHAKSQRAQAQAAATAAAEQRHGQARLARQRGDVDGASRAYLEVLAVSPSDRLAADSLREIERQRTQRGNLLAQRPSLSWTASRATPGVSGGPSVADAAQDPALEHASLLAGQGDLESAIGLLRALASSGRGTPPVRQSLGELYWRQAQQAESDGDRPKAVAALRQCLQWAPGHRAASDRLAALGAGLGAPAGARPGAPGRPAESVPNDLVAPARSAR